MPTRTDNGSDKDTQVRAARIRVARAFAKKTQQEIADHLGVHLQTVKRMENGLAAINDERLFSIAEFCGVPQRFMLVGFADDKSVTRELRQVRRERDAMREEFTAVLDRYTEASEFGRQVADRLRAIRE